MRAAAWVVLGLSGLVATGCAEQSATAPLEVNEVSEARAEASLKAASSPTLVDVALQVNAETGEFSTLIAAVVRADLLDALSARGQRTVFAPTDAAFAELGLDKDNIDTLDVDALTNILLYHVANGRRYAEDVVTSDRIRMLNGGFNEISVTAEGAFIGSAKIVATDVEASNGLIHVIDTVLLP